MAQPYLPDAQLFQQLGIKPPAGKGKSKGNKRRLYDDCLQVLRVMDEQNHLSRFSWFVEHYYGIDANLVERILYYRGTGILWYHEPLNKFMFTPYVGKGLDVYGRYTKCSPLPFTGSTSVDGEEREYIPGLELTPVYDLMLDDDAKDKCVIFYDYSKQLPQRIIPRQALNEPLCAVEAECIPFTRTALINATGVMGYKIDAGDDAQSVEDANSKLVEAALDGSRWVAMQNSINAQELSGGTSASVQENLLVMQAIDNLRLSTHGIDSGSLYQKKAHMLQSEQAMNNQDSSSVITDCLWNRRHSCEIAMSIWQLPIWVDISQSQSMFDRDYDGQLDTDQQGPEEYDSNTYTEEVTVDE